jgi:O-antigen/teichoic acid export membrane protein
MTISAIIAFLGFSDLGINNGLLNGIAKAHGRDDRQLARQYVSSAFFLLIAIALVLGVGFTAAYPWIHWASFFRVHSAQAIAEAGPAVAVFAGCFLLNIPASIVSRVQSGYQEGFVANLWLSLGSVFYLISLLLVIHLHGSLSLLVLAMAGAPIVALLMNGAVQFGIQRPWLFPSWLYVKSGVSKNLLHLGGLFFVLQLSGAVGYSSDNIVLARIMGPEAVTQYAVPCRLFSLVAMASSFLVTPLWPAYGEALERRDHSWIRRTLIRSLVLVTGVSILLSGVLVAFGGRIIHLWVGPSIHPSQLLLAGLGISGVLSAVSSTTAMFLNGLSVIRFQVVIAALGAFTNIAISVSLTRRIGIPGVVYGSILSQVVVVAVPYYWYLRRYFQRNAVEERNLLEGGDW